MTNSIPTDGLPDDDPTFYDEKPMEARIHRDRGFTELMAEAIVESLVSICDQFAAEQGVMGDDAPSAADLVRALLHKSMGGADATPADDPWLIVESDGLAAIYSYTRRDVDMITLHWLNTWIIDHDDSFND